MLSSASNVHLSLSHLAAAESLGLLLVFSVNPRWLWSVHCLNCCQLNPRFSFLQLSVPQKSSHGDQQGNSLRTSLRLNFWFSFWPSCSLFYLAGLPISSLSLSLSWSGHECSPTLALFPVKTILKILLDRVVSNVSTTSSALMMSSI